MERIVSPEERLRRAEEIYYRRRAQGVRVSTATVSVGSKNKTTIGKKMGIQILVCIIIYSTFWLIKGYNNVFSNTFINHTKAVLSYDVNFPKLYNETVEYLNNNINSIIKKEESTEGEEQGESKDENQEDSQAETQTEAQENEEQKNDVGEENQADQQDNSKEENVGNDAVEDGNNQENNSQNSGTSNENDGTIKAQNDAKNINQMNEDAEYIKNNFSMIKPIQGNITSGFGSREQTDIISAFHQGIDISGTQGTPIIAAVDGTVVASSFAGDYGNHIKIQNGEILTVYAHCSELEVKVGDSVKQGQEIGKVGATGKVTRTTFAF